jgi:protein ImuA
MNHPRPKMAAAAMAALRQEIRRLEGFKNPLAQANAVRFGIPEIDNALPEKSFPLGVTHEFISHAPEEAAATAGFLSGLVALMTKDSGSVAWIGRQRPMYAPGLAAYGLDPKRILFIQAERDRDALWAMEEALRCKGLAAVVGEAADADLTATRRLQLAAEESGATGILLRANPRKTGTSACVTRWHIRPLQSGADNGLPGVGVTRWRAELLKTRGGRAAGWDIEWKNGRFRLPAATAAIQESQAARKALRA